ncbi:hypothetical protein AB4851_08275 [Burkholderia sp. 22PA0099]|uniref:hypothetical protein n=1 Tax=Burkholderia sp. 22PA0099 TaxID=3237372 RepID=UPI0039C0BB08
MSNQDEVPDSFPRKLAPGSVPGVQPKMLLRQVGERYSNELDNEDVLARYRGCEDLACQLRDYVLRKVTASGFSLADALARAEKGVRQKVDSGQWDFSSDEVAWVAARTHVLVAEKSNDREGDGEHGTEASDSA